ncbi:enoyl-CoA hydratase/isomerase family protein [Aeromicrobium ginsengisoli]|uniref:Enoyl-CoA hydratase/isomerase family protein n=1 Tax=Aeromicrobium ginsengisoli TaxID=363867 RepID=A0A5M4F960_9ACTN|nr:enoyl-CoA hydratase/isomerase family protein [Aeromicrobium ginsengisoli]KAA1394300.1 enoyl-CoA hydratase/isomerase family protein [Aeromicrobium ginsengisoli]
MSWVEVGSQLWSPRGAELGIGPDGRPTTPVVILTDGLSAPSNDAYTEEPGPVVVVLASSSAEVAPALAERADVVLVERDPDRRAVAVADPLASARALATIVCERPTSSLSLVWLLRSESYRDLRRGLVAESATYSMLLAGEEFQRWREDRPRRSREQAATPRTRVSRDGDVLRVTLTHPSRRNAMDAQMRDELLEALELARWDESLSVVLDADGPCFSSGGDLDEFATTPDPSRAHLIRSTASVGGVLAELSGRVLVRVHGDCFGAGVELPAFAGRVVARPGTTFTLPEISMGLVPGAGGTTSIPRRIGRHRTTWWALSGRTLDASTALTWGLIDATE